MEKLKLQTQNGVTANIERISELFPNCVTETLDANGRIKLAVDFDMLKQELSNEVVEGKDERYQFVWPDKKKAILLANAPVNATLRPNRDESVDFDNTENLYIEGDNLDVLKCLKETYLGKVKMIYIDPPYNTGNDFVYNDDFAEKASEYLENSGQYDDQGNRLFANLDSNGRFHSDWLNMIYPRLKTARDLLSNDGVIFISIGDNECSNLQTICNEIFGQNNFIAKINIITGANQAGEGVLIQKNVEYCLVYAKKIVNATINRVDKTVESYRNLNDAPTPFETRKDMGYTIYYNPNTLEMIPMFDYNKDLIYTDDETLVYNDIKDLIEKGYVPVRPGRRNGKLHRWRWGIETFKERIAEIKMFPNGDSYSPKFLQSGFNPPKNTQNFTVGTNDLKLLFGDKVPFEYSKGIPFMKYLCSIGANNDSFILDFFSGSGTTAHAVMQLNAEDGGKRKFIMVQLPEPTDEKSVAYKSGYKNICEIGKERIRRAAKKIKDESGADIDYGFRVLKLDSSNMQDVFYSPAELKQDQLDLFADNIKPDRTGEDLLFQVMLELGATLDSKIEKKVINGKDVFVVSDGYIVACFDKEVNDDVVKTIAQMQPQYAVLRDGSLADDSTASNFEQIFKTYSSGTICKII